MLLRIFYLPTSYLISTENIQNRLLKEIQPLKIIVTFKICFESACKKKKIMHKNCLERMMEKLRVKLNCLPNLEYLILADYPHTGKKQID